MRHHRMRHRLGRDLSIALTLTLAAGATTLAMAREAVPAPEVCVIAPHLQTRADGTAWALLPMANPTLVVAEPLQEARLLRGQQLLWQRQAPDGQALTSPLPWPLPPLRGGESLQLLLRPVGQSPGHFAPIDLRAAPAADLIAHTALIQRLAGDGAAWRAAIEQQLLGGDVAEAWALLFAPEAPAQRELQALRLEVIGQGCGD